LREGQQPGVLVGRASWLVYRVERIDLVVVVKVHRFKTVVGILRNNGLPASSASYLLSYPLLQKKHHRINLTKYTMWTAKCVEEKLGAVVLTV